MNRRLFMGIMGLVVAASISVYSLSASAEEDVAELKKQIEALQKRVEELESSKMKTDKKDSSGFFNRGRIGGWDPFREMERMQEEMNRMFDNSFHQGGSPNRGMFSNDMSFDYDLDLKETQGGYEIVFDMTGLNQEKIDIQINEHSITVQGERSSENREESPNSLFHAQSFGSFMKTIPLPVDADTEQVTTEKEGDHLVIRIPKKAS